MLRLTAEGVALGLVPFIAYGVLLLFAMRWPWLRSAGPGGHGLMLASCGVGLVALGLVALGVLSGRSLGSYVPAHLEQGRLVPGHFE
jgi:hypothetical protein